MGNHGAPIPDLPRQGLCKLATGCHQSGYPWARVRRRESPDLPRQGLCKLATRLAPKAATRGPGCVGVPNPRAAERPPATRRMHFGFWSKPGTRVLSLRGGTSSLGFVTPSRRYPRVGAERPTAWLVCSTPAGVDRKMLCSYLGDVISSLSTGRRGAPTAWLVCSTPAGVGRKMLCSFLADAIPVVIHG